MEFANISGAFGGTKCPQFGMGVREASEKNSGSLSAQSSEKSGSSSGHSIVVGIVIFPVPV